MSIVGATPRRQRLTGALFLCLVALAVGVLVWLAGSSVGDGVRFRVEFATPGPLHTGAHILLAGRVVGEVQALRRIEAATDGTHHVAAECYIGRADARHLHRNSDLFIASPSILGEAFIEIGPPRSGEPGAPVQGGDLLRGADPPDLDRLLARIYSSATVAYLLLQEQRPHFDELLRGTDSLLATLSGLPVEKGQIARIRAGLSDALAQAAALSAAVRESGISPRASVLADQLSATATRVKPDLADIGRKADLASQRVSTLRTFVGGAEQAKLERGLSAISSAAKSFEQLSDNAKTISKIVARGQGAVSGLLGDRELFDDLHETHRLLKWKAWRLLVKPPKGQPTAPE